MKIILVRHGESTDDSENLYGGWHDDHLTAKGKQQSSKIVERLSRKGVEVVYTSTLSRAKETASIIAKKLDRPLQPVESFRERNFYGILTGMNRDEAAKKYPSVVKLLSSYKNTIDGAEDYTAFKNRVLYSLESIAASGHKSVIIVTHGGPIRCIARELLKVGELKNLEDCAFLELEYDGKYKVVEMYRIEKG